jgi:hypothetical protein
MMTIGILVVIEEGAAAVVVAEGSSVMTTMIMMTEIWLPVGVEEDVVSGTIMITDTTTITILAGDLGSRGKGILFQDWMSVEVAAPRSTCLH